MSSEFPDQRGEFLDDFYAECDELLGNIGGCLNRLDDSSNSVLPQASDLESLFRYVHSFKGISAIVGLREAEELAHHAENLLRLLSQRALAWQPAHLDLLAHVNHRLEQIVTAHRRQQSLPDTRDLLLQLQPYDRPATPRPPSESGAAAIERDSAAPADVPATAGKIRWRASFSPSAELDQRGVNINQVRTRLSALGEIVRAAPSIHAGGSMSFEFEIAIREIPTDPDTWERDGIILRPLESGPASVAPTQPRNLATDAGASSMFVAPSHIVRVDLSRLDDLMRITGELVIHRSRLEERIAHLTGDRSALQEVNLSFGRSLRELREAITRVRLVPVAEIFGRLPFVVRDLANETGKKVRLTIEGHDTEIDKYLVERLKEPLLHLVRNAISHGVETPGDRTSAGKPAEATLTLRASTAGQWVVIQIRDDGRGVDAAKIVARATAAGIAISNPPTDAELLNVITRPGFSTRDEADRAAGRGVGMAVVQRTVRDLGGSLSLASESGLWTQFTLKLPLTLSIAETLLVSGGGQTCAIPQGFVDQIIEVDAAQVRRVQRTEVAPYRDGVLPLTHLRSLFGVAPATSGSWPTLVLNSEAGSRGLVVDRVIGQREVVVRAMQDPLIQVAGVSGATELGDGRPVLILDPAAFSGSAVRPPQRPIPATRAESVAPSVALRSAAAR
jgi:two-component system chemotaxis sensor kinase CheA